MLRDVNGSSSLTRALKCDTRIKRGREKEYYQPSL